MIIQWTTPTLELSVPEGIEFDWLMLTFKQDEYQIDKIVDGSAVVDNKFSIFFTQEETSGFDKDYIVKAQINMMKGEQRIATTKAQLEVDDNLYDAYIDPTTPSILEITENGVYDVSNYSTIKVNIGG